MLTTPQVATPRSDRAAEAKALTNAGLGDDVQLRLRDLCALTNRSETALRNMIRAGRFPAADYRDGQRCVRWSAGIVRRWLEANRIGGQA